MDEDGREQVVWSISGGPGWQQWRASYNKAPRQPDVIMRPAGLPLESGTFFKKFNYLKARDEKGILNEQ